MAEAMFREEKRQFVATHDYEPFGVELEPFGNDTTDNKYRFTGQERDYSTNFDYMHFRYYASAMGRFLKPDNIIPDIKSPQSWNAYAYVNGNPVNFSDPTGHLYRAGRGQQSVDYAPWMGISETPELEDYLWGGASMLQSVVYYRVSQGTKVVDWGFYSDMGFADVMAGKASSHYSKALPPGDPIESYLRAAAQAQKENRREVAFAVAKVEGKPVAGYMSIGAGVNYYGGSFDLFVNAARNSFKTLLSSQSFVMDVGHTHPEPGAIAQRGDKYLIWHGDKPEVRVAQGITPIQEGGADFSSREYKYFQKLATQPDIDRVFVVRGNLARYFQ